MLPAFDVEGGVALAVARAASDTALLSILGTLAFRGFVAPRAFERMPAEVARRLGQRLRRLAQFSVGTGALALLAWLVLQSADMAEAASVMQAVAAVPVVLADTAFGHLIALQLVAMLAMAGVLGFGRGHRLALGLAVVATALQAGHSHAASMYSGPSLLLASDVLHLLGAGVWLGGLLPLLLLVRDAPPKAGATAARWFSPLGKWCIAALVVSAGYQGWVLVASVPGLVGTGYGWMVLLKLALLGVLLAFAAANRYRFAPALLQGDPVVAKRVLVRSIAVQTGFGVAIVAAAAVLGSLAPAMHLQPVWPFTDRFTLDTVQEDADFMNEAVGAGLALGGAALLLLVAVLLRRRVRWLALVAAVVVAWFAAPHLDLLFVPAYPTSYYHSPTEFAATTIVQGAELFPTHCAACHGANGQGDGPAAKGLPVPPADLTAAHLWAHSDGELFWWLAHGIPAPEGGQAMPGFGETLSDDQRWALIDYIRAHNAGVGFRSSGAWSPPIQAPALQADCSGGRTMSLANFQGRFVRLVIGAVASPDAGVTTILATSDPSARPAPGVCVARDPAVPRAYAIASGLADGQFLIDGAGWLRAGRPAGATPDWNDPAALSAEIHQLEAHPVAGDSHAHMEM